MHVLYCLVSTIDFCLSEADWTDPTQRQSEVEMPVKLQIIVSACSLLSAVYCLFRKNFQRLKNEVDEIEMLETQKEDGK